MDLEVENAKLKECTKQLNQLLAEAQQKLKSVYQERESEKTETQKNYAAAKNCIFSLRGRLQESLKRNEAAEKLNGKLNAEIQQLQVELHKLEVESKNCKEDQSINGDRLNQQLMTSKLKSLEEQLQLAIVQAETFKNDFELERKSREKLNDVKLQLEQKVQFLISQMIVYGIAPNDPEAMFSGETPDMNCVNETDSTNENRCFLCQKKINGTQLNQHVLECLERMEKT